jgi:hypothetical protein
MREEHRRLLRTVIPPRLRRLYRKYVSPLVRDRHFEEYRTRREFFRRAFDLLAFNGIDGDYVEFGCCGGLTFGLAHRLSRRAGMRCRLWAFDSFAGLPPQQGPADEHPAWVEGSMAIGEAEFRRICREHGIPRSSYEVVPGFYGQTLAPGQDRPLPGNICLAYVDCDLYSSARDVLAFLLPRLKHGMIIAFDDYYCWSSTQVSGERRACGELFRDSAQWRLLPFHAYGGGMSFVVEDARLAGPAGACF